MRIDLEEIKNIDKDTDNQMIFIDENRICELVRRPSKPGTGGAYWSFYKLGKSPNAFKDPKLQNEKSPFALDQYFKDYESYFEEFKEQEFEEIEVYE